MELKPGFRTAPPSFFPDTSPLPVLLPPMKISSATDEDTLRHRWEHPSPPMRTPLATDEDTLRNRGIAKPSTPHPFPTKNICDISPIITNISYLCKQINYFSYPSNNKISNHQYPYTDENTYLPTSNRLYFCILQHQTDTSWNWLHIVCKSFYWHRFYRKHVSRRTSPLWHGTA